MARNGLSLLELNPLLLCHDLNCESSAALARKGLRTDGARDNLNFYTFSKHAMTYGRPVFIEFRSAFVPKTLSGRQQVTDSKRLIAGQ
jgi:hypothetical protein